MGRHRNTIIHINLKIKRKKISNPRIPMRNSFIPFLALFFGCFVWNRWTSAHLQCVKCDGDDIRSYTNKCNQIEALIRQHDIDFTINYHKAHNFNDDGNELLVEYDGIKYEQFGTFIVYAHTCIKYTSISTWLALNLFRLFVCISYLPL